MTFPGDRIGDLGQRYAVQAEGYPNRDMPGWQSIAYTSNLASAERMAEGIRQHPCVTAARVLDRASQ